MSLMRKHATENQQTTLSVAFLADSDNVTTVLLKQTHAASPSNGCRMTSML